MSVQSPSLHCKAMATTHYENFPVGRFVSKSVRPHIHAIYAFARTADDFADESSFEGKRLENLAQWRQMLLDAAAGHADHPVFQALCHTIREHHIPISLLDDLIKAFESDVFNNRHSTFEALLNYSSLSANPVGRLVLWVHGYRDEELFRRSDAICTALQLTNFWQDVAIDWKKNRVYLPQEEMDRFGYSESKIAEDIADGTYLAMMQSLISRTRSLFEKGRPLCDQIKGKLKLEIKLVWCGGMRVLEKIEKNDYDVFRHRPTLNAFDYMLMMFRALTWRKSEF